MTKALVGVMAIAVLDCGGNVVFIKELDEVFAKFGSRGEVGFAVLPMPVKNVIEAFGEFQFPPEIWSRLFQS